MNRTLGFFLGSAVVFALLVFVLGQPIHLASPVVRDLPTVTKTTTTPIRIPAPVTLQDSVQTVSEPVATVPAPQAPLPVVENTAPVTVETIPLAPPEAVAAATAAPTSPVPDTDVDENTLADRWLSSAPALPVVEHSVDAPVAQPVDPLTDSVANQTAVPDPANQEWYPVWEPFHSELSANAFARRLERVTGLDYRVIKTDSAEYRVVMGYTSEEQRLVNVAMIEDATGLSINGGSL